MTSQKAPTRPNVVLAALFASTSTRGTLMSSISSSQPAVVDAAEFTVRRTIRIAAPVEKVWSAVTEPEHISRWFGRTELDGSGAGARGTMTFAERGSIPLRVEAMDAPRL